MEDSKPSTRPEPLSAGSWLEINFECDKSGRGYIDRDNGQLYTVQDILDIYRVYLLHNLRAAAPRTQGSELECKHCGQTIRPAKDSKVRGYWIGTNNYLTCSNNVGQPHEPLAAQPQPAPRPPVCPKCKSTKLQLAGSSSGKKSEPHRIFIICESCGVDFRCKTTLDLIPFFTAIPAALPLAQAADEVLAELSLLNGKFTQKQNALFDKVREFAAIPDQKEEK